MELQIAVQIAAKAVERRGGGMEIWVPREREQIDVKVHILKLSALPRRTRALTVDVKVASRGIGSGTPPLPDNPGSIK